MGGVRGSARRVGLGLGAVAVLAGGLLGQMVTGSASATTVGHHPMYMPAVGNSGLAALQPPPVQLPPICVPSPIGVCVPYHVPPAGVPAPVNMAYFGGPVQAAPKIYLVLWGWREPGAFDSSSSDPIGAGARMASFLSEIGGTAWAGVSTQYFQMVGGLPQFIANPANQLGGEWVDNTTPIHNNLTGLELAQEADRARAHFGVTDLANAQFVIAQPQNFNEAGFNAKAGYCAWHDYTQPSTYPGVKPGIAFTNMPYVLNLGTVCGQDSVNTAAAGGDLDGFTIVLGHEVEETVTDPGAEVVSNGTNLGAWFDYGGWENGDKCAWVGFPGVSLVPPSTVRGGLNNITGNDGHSRFAVQSLWSNQAAGGAGYCAGAGDDLGF